MALKFHPKQGTIVLVRFEPGFKPPEMVKTRLGIIVSKQMKHRPGLCTIVPLSRTDPRTPQPYHCRIEPAFDIPDPWGNGPRWVKGDLIYSVGFHRLDLLRTRRLENGRRIYLTDTISALDLKRVQRAILEGMSLGRLTKHL